MNMVTNRRNSFRLETLESFSDWMIYLFGKKQTLSEHN